MLEVGRRGGAIEQVRRRSAQVFMIAAEAVGLGAQQAPERGQPAADYFAGWGARLRIAIE